MRCEPGIDTRKEQLSLRLRLSLPEAKSSRSFMLVVAIDKLCSPTLAANNAMSFRVSSLRHELQVDTIPTHEGANSLSQVILAELEGAVGNESQ